MHEQRDRTILVRHERELIGIATEWCSVDLGSQADARHQFAIVR